MRLNAGQRGTRGQRRDERWLSGVWDRQAFERHQLRTTSGLTFKVVFPGMCTGGAGPDFRDAILALADGTLLRGDVELHLESSGWRQHGHHRDPAYDRVLLHVVLEDDEPAHNSRGEPLLTLELAGRLGPRRLPAPEPPPTGLRSPSSPAATHGTGTALEVLPPAAPTLLHGQPSPHPLPSAQAAASPDALTLVPPGELAPVTQPGALTSEMPPDALTAPAPQDALTIVPPGELPSVASPDGPRAAVPPSAPAPIAPSASESGQLTYIVAPCQHALPRRGVAGVEALLGGLALERFAAKQTLLEGELAVFAPEQVLYAGLLEALGYSRNRTPFRRLAELAPAAALRCVRDAEGIHQLLLAAAGLAPDDDGLMGAAGLVGPAIDPSDWQRVGVRPDNLPARRIAQAAVVLERLLPAGLLDELLAPILDLAADAAEADRRQALLLRAEWRRLLAEVGRQRADAIAVNVLLPFAAAYGQATCQFGLSEAAIRAFLAFPAEGANQVTGYMRQEILGAVAGAARGAAGEQGLLHVWDRWCHHKVCALCPLASRAAPSKEPPT